MNIASQAIGAGIVDDESPAPCPLLLWFDRDGARSAAEQARPAA